MLNFADAEHHTALRSLARVLAPEIRKTLDWEYHGCYSKERQALQDMWITDIVRGGTKHDNPWIIYTAGAMGAGKGYAIHWMSQQGHFPLPDIVQVDPDAIRENEAEWPEVT